MMDTSLRAALFAVIGVASSALTGMSCTSSDEPSVTPEANVDEPTNEPNAWSTGQCGSCALTNCARERGLCDAEPSCVAHAKCAEACPADARGLLDAACLAQCPLVEESGGARVRAAYDSCLVGRGMSACDTCPLTKLPPSVERILSQQCQPSTETNACYACEDERCCETYQACVDEPECKQELQPCLVACKSDKRCAAACYASHPGGVQTWARRQSCLVANCKTECGEPADACVACVIDGPCRETEVRCDSDEGCFLIRACIDATCPDVTDACVQTCKKSASEVSGRFFDEFVSCALLSCSDVCG